ADLAQAVADELAADGIVAWFQGRSEYGPRALGHRSLLAHPGQAALCGGSTTSRAASSSGRSRPWCARTVRGQVSGVGRCHAPRPSRVGAVPGPQGASRGAHMTVSSVIPTVGRGTLATLLDSLAHRDGPVPAEVIVVDDRPGGPPLGVEFPGWLDGRTRILRSG